MGNQTQTLERGILALRVFLIDHQTGFQALRGERVNNTSEFLSTDIVL